MILTVTMNPSIDMSYPIDHLKIDDVNRVKDVSKTAGGKGLNVSRVINFMGTDILATGIIGGFFGKFIEKNLDQEQIQHSFTHIDQETRNSIALLHDNGNQTEILESGPTIAEEDNIRFLKDYKKLLEKTDLVTMSGSLPRGLGSDYYSKMIDIAKENNVKVILDSSGETLRTSLLNNNKPFLIKPNQNEIGQLVGEKFERSNYDSIPYYLNSSIFDGVEWIVVSLGADGAIAKHNKKFYRVKIPVIKVVNPVGSGDSTLAGLSVAISHEKSDEEILKTGMTTGILNTMEKRTGFINKDLFSKYYDEITVESMNYVKEG
ncbi:tagatose-6-phosphate kinase [Companilactobacillus baiquanensis]|uniref:Tagatose-6-phosphate kinase n=1 Tax=Companilactobacillus baiquanensis TaxID=2486005 RepID=A0ABW1UU29_9LACO|nr:tagatose-6-phosphate kinase [Companilactobacillus baiquanensis]